MAFKLLQLRKQNACFYEMLLAEAHTALQLATMDVQPGLRNVNASHSRNPAHNASEL
ncbi:MAG: hypothetical protein ACM3SW_18305 [Actinomycetota bacterium]